MFLALVMIYREIPSGKTNETEITRENLVPSPVTLTAGTETGYDESFAEQETLYTDTVAVQCTENSAGLSTNFSENSAGGTVNINTADMKSLMTLKGIGEKKARNIIEYRAANGAFTSIDEIASVPGIGKKTAENVRDFITV